MEHIKFSVKGGEVTHVGNIYNDIISKKKKSISTLGPFGNIDDKLEECV